MPERTYDILVNGQPYTVRVGDLADNPVTVRVNGRSYQVEIAPSAKPEAAAGPIRLSETAVLPQQPQMPAIPSDQRIISAPMPGHILNIAVRSGELVERGQILCALEAMKMKNAIRAPKDGEITAVHVSHGQSVNHGQPLFNLRPTA